MPKVKIGLAGAFIALTSLVAITSLLGCSSSSASANSGRLSKSANSAVIGRIVQEGGASKASAARPIDGTAAIYRHDPSRALKGNRAIAIEKVMAKDGSKFDFRLRASGTYFAVAQDSSGHLISDVTKVRTWSAAARSVTLVVRVP